MSENIPLPLKSDSMAKMNRTSSFSRGSVAWGGHFGACTCCLVYKVSISFTQKNKQTRNWIFTNIFFVSLFLHLKMYSCCFFPPRHMSLSVFLVIMCSSEKLFHLAEGMSLYCVFSPQWPLFSMCKRTKQTRKRTQKQIKSNQRAIFSCSCRHIAGSLRISLFLVITRFNDFVVKFDTIHLYQA